MDQTNLPKLLYIDDTPDSRVLVSRILSREYVILEAGDAISGIELAVDTQPDLILVDINLPELSGHDVATRLNTLLPNTPLVAFTADTSPGARERALAAGCVGYLSKPLNVDTFPDQVRAFLRGRREEGKETDKYREAYRVDLVKRLEEKVRELTKTADRKDYLSEQNRQMVIVLKRRQQLLEAGARVAHSITSILDLDELLSTTVNIICDEYNFYYSAIYLLDPDGDRLELHAGHGDAGAAMLAEGHHLAVSDDLLAGIAVRKRAAQIARDLDEDSKRLQNSHLPNAQSEMVLPLIVTDTVLGVLSVQGDRADAFADDDLTALQSLADQIAIAINNAQLLRDLNDVHQELVRTKTFEAIATATGEAIHWVGNKAAPIPASANRVREDIYQLLAILQALLTDSPEVVRQHPLWPTAQKTFDLAANKDIDLTSIAENLSALDHKRLDMVVGGLESILEDLAIVEQSATTILSIKEDLIGPARLQEVTAVPLVDLIQETVPEMGLPGGVVQIEFDKNLPPVHADSRQLGRVFINLIKNAWEALYQHEQPRIEISVQYARDPGFAVVHIRDNGPGIPPELLDKIWVSFFTTKGDRGGTGLGLAACMEIARQSGGSIRVESEVGVGTTFSVLLPFAKE